MEKVVNYIVKQMIKNQAIEEQERDVYCYGVRNGIMIALNWCVIIITGIWYACLAEMLVFAMGYSVLRSNAGGFHMTTHKKCFVFSVLLYQVVACFLSKCRISFLMYTTVLLICVVMIFLLAPIENENKPLDEKEQRVYGLRARCIVMLFGSIGIVCEQFLWFRFANAFACAIILTVVLCLVGIISNEKRKIYP